MLDSEVGLIRPMLLFAILTAAIHLMLFARKRHEDSWIFSPTVLKSIDYYWYAAALLGLGSLIINVEAWKTEAAIESNASRIGLIVLNVRWPIVKNIQRASDLCNDMEKFNYLFYIDHQDARRLTIAPYQGGINDAQNKLQKILELRCSYVDAASRSFEEFEANPKYPISLPAVIVYGDANKVTSSWREYYEALKSATDVQQLLRSASSADPRSERLHSFSRSVYEIVYLASVYTSDLADSDSLLNLEAPRFTELDSLLTNRTHLIKNTERLEEWVHVSAIWVWILPILISLKVSKVTAEILIIRNRV